MLKCVSKCGILILKKCKKSPNTGGFTLRHP